MLIEYIPVISVIHPSIVSVCNVVAEFPSAPSTNRIVLGVGQRTTDISVRTAFGQSGRDGMICKYIFNKGAGIILINNNTGFKQAVLAFSKANTGDYRITAIHNDNGWGALMKDSDNNLYIRHSSDWGSHLIICSTAITPDGYVTSTEGLTDITVS